MNAMLNAVHERAAAPRPLTPPPVPRFGSLKIATTFRPDAYGGAWVQMGPTGYQSANAKAALDHLYVMEQRGDITLELLSASPPRTVTPSPTAPCSP